MASAYGGETNADVADLHKQLLPKKPADAVAPKTKTEPALKVAGGSGPDIANLKEAGGFRRDHLHRQADVEGRPLDQRPASWDKPLLQTLRPLLRVGYFESVLGIRLDDDGQEISPEPGQSGTWQTALALAKSFVGSGITFLPGAFAQGGWLFSSIFLVIIGFCNAVCIWLLLECSTSTGLSGFGDIAQKAGGNFARQAVHISLVISQMGTNVAYMIFISQMADALGILKLVSSGQLIVLMLFAIIPLSFIRNLHRMELAILVADALIVFGLGAVVWFTTLDLLKHGHENSVSSFKPATCGLFVGTAVFTFEGIPFILPIRSSMREPTLFWPLFLKVFVFIVIFFAFFGCSGYVDFGSETQTVVLLNLPKGNPVVMLVVAAYMVALVFCSPMVFLLAARITELWIFGVSKEKGSKKWQKNALRTVEMCAMGFVALYGGSYFAIFLSLVGAFCCAPIAFIYPALFHLRICAEGCFMKALDCLFIALGILTMVFVIYETVRSF